MTQTDWIIMIVGGVLAYVNIIAAGENEKRLDRIIELLHRNRG